MADAHDTGSATAWCAAARQLVDHLGELGRQRLALASLELAAERRRLLAVCLHAALTVLALLLSLMLAAAWVVLWCEPDKRLMALGGLCALLVATTLGLAWRAHRLWQGRHLAGPADALAQAPAWAPVLVAAGALAWWQRLGRRP